MTVDKLEEEMEAWEEYQRAKLALHDAEAAYQKAQEREWIAKRKWRESVLPKEFKEEA
jgi:hypothetical protein